MSALRRKVLEQAIVAELRAAGAGRLGKTGLRELVIAEIGPVPASDFDAAIQSLRYQGKLHWNHLELAASMRPAAAGPDDDEDPAPDYPTETNDIAAEPRAPAVEGGAAPAAPTPRASGRPGAGAPPSTFGRRMVHAANTRGATKAPPAPRHESEVQRAVRLDADVAQERRRQSRSTGTVRVPLELKRMMEPEPTLAEAIQTALVSEPHDLIATINRKHPQLWKRVIALSRRAGGRPAQALYDVIEAGLDELEREEERDAA